MFINPIHHVTAESAEIRQSEQQHINSLIRDCYQVQEGQLISAYLRQVPNMQEKAEKQPSTKTSKLFKLGLIGSLDNSGVTSSNYKNFFYSTDEEK